MANFTDGEWKAKKDFIIANKDGMIGMVADFIPYFDDARLMAQSKKMYEGLLEILGNENVEIYPRGITSNVHGPDIELWATQMRAILSEIDEE